MNYIKNIIIKLLDKNKGLKNYIYTVYKKYRISRSIFKTLAFAIKGVFLRYTPSHKLLRGEQIKRAISKTKVEIDDERYFAFSLDVFKLLYSNDSIIENTTVDYNIILNTSTKEMEKKCHTIEGK